MARDNWEKIARDRCDWRSKVSIGITNMEEKRNELAMRKAK